MNVHPHHGAPSESWQRPPGAERSEVRLTRVGSVPVLSIRGDVDIPDAAALDPIISGLIARGPRTAAHSDSVSRPEAVATPVLILDLSAVGFFGSSGLNLIVLARRRADAAGTTVRLVLGTARALRRVLDVSGLGTALPCFATIEDATS